VFQNKIVKFNFDENTKYRVKDGCETIINNDSGFMNNKKKCKNQKLNELINEEISKMIKNNSND
jgi:hypothetical protein